MGAQQSQVVNGTVSDIAKNYSTLLDTMMTNQIGFASSMKDISDAEREWFGNFEKYISENNADVSSEDSLYKNIQAFTRLSGDDTSALLSQISDASMRASAESVLNRTNKAIVMQKYYEYKYLHLSSVFMNFTEFVQKLFELMASASVQVAENQAVLTTKDVSDLLDAMASIIPAQDAVQMRKTVQTVHKNAHDRLKLMAKQMDKIIEVSKEHIGDFPMRQLEQQQQEGRVQLQRDIDDVVKQVDTVQGDRPRPQREFDQRPPRPQREFDQRPPRPQREFGDDRKQPFDRREGAQRPAPAPPPGQVPSPSPSPTAPAPASTAPAPAFGFSSEDNPRPPPRDKPSQPSPSGFGFGEPVAPTRDQGQGRGSSEDEKPAGEGKEDKENKEDKSRQVDKSQELSEKRPLPDEAFLFGGGGFLARAASEIDAIVKGGGRMRARTRGGARKKR
eukprot:jgi/Tetstr1/447210/TSEL_034647.t1